MSASKVLRRSLSCLSRSSSESFATLMSSESAHRWSSSEKPVCLPVCQVVLAPRQRLAQLEHALLALGRVGVEHLVDLLLELVEVLRARLVVDPRDDRSGEVEDLLELLRRHVEQVADAARHALEEPDVADRRGEVDVAHALAADLASASPRRRSARRRCPCNERACTCRSSTPSPWWDRRCARRRGRPSRA